MHCPKCGTRIGFFQTFGTSFPRLITCDACKAMLRVSTGTLAFNVAFAICAVLDVLLGMLSWQWMVVIIALSNPVIFYAVFTRLVDLTPRET